MSDSASFVLVLFVSSLIVGAITFLWTASYYQQLAIENNCAQFNSTTAAFEWKPVITN